jgi:hypothetical protein
VERALIRLAGAAQMAMVRRGPPFAKERGGQASPRNLDSGCHPLPNLVAWGRRKLRSHETVIRVVFIDVISRDRPHRINVRGARPARTGNVDGGKNSVAVALESVPRVVCVNVESRDGIRLVEGVSSGTLILARAGIWIIEESHNPVGSSQVAVNYIVRSTYEISRNRSILGDAYGNG